MDASRSKFTPCSPYKIYPKWNWVDLVSFLGISSLPHLLPLSLAFLPAPGFFLQATCFLFCLFLLQASVQFSNFSWMLILTLPMFRSHTGIQVQHMTAATGYLFSMAAVPLLLLVCSSVLSFLPQRLLHVPGRGLPHSGKSCFNSIKCLLFLASFLI